LVVSLILKAESSPTPLSPASLSTSSLTSSLTTLPLSTPSLGRAPLQTSFFSKTTGKHNSFLSTLIIISPIVENFYLWSKQITSMPDNFAGIVGILIMAGMAAEGANRKKKEKYSNSNYPTTPMFYARQSQSQLQEPAMLSATQKPTFDNVGSQMLNYQLYQQAVNAATPTMQQLEAISGQSQEQTGKTSLDGGLSEAVAPYAMLSDGGPSLYSSEFQAVNLGNERAQSISACAQNAPSFLATSLLPKPVIPGQQAWEVNAPNNILANQSFLSATQQIGVDTTLSSRRNIAPDIRNTIPNPMNTVGPWNQSTKLPDLERRQLDCFIPQGQGIYGCGAPGANTNGTFVGA
jgi:hypothetical protein